MEYSVLLDSRSVRKAGHLFLEEKKIWLCDFQLKICGEVRFVKSENAIGDLREEAIMQKKKTKKKISRRNT